VVTDLEDVVKRAVRIAREHTVAAVNGSTIPLNVETLCVHGDTEGSDVLGARLRAGLEAGGITVQSLMRT
jgi:UPF0271 protein